jgi:hypothetical protein
MSDELVKIARAKMAAEGMGGAMAGGAIGSGLGLMLGRGSLKGGLYGGLIGAGIGGLAGGVAHAGRKLLAPSPGMYGPPTGDPNYVPTWQSGPPNMGYSY